MEGRARLAIGGAGTVMASIAVVCAVAFTNSVALADSPATPVTAPRITVPSSGETSPTRPLADAGQQVPTPAPIAVTVEAPAPEVLNAGGDETSLSADAPAAETPDGAGPGTPAVPPGKPDVPPGKPDAPGQGPGDQQQRPGGGTDPKAPGEAELQGSDDSGRRMAISEAPVKPVPPGQAKKDDRSRDSAERRDR
ncbi:hypothetical protein ASD56_13950 [Microbacterium sp. Root166]|nr:hypothetical protein ASD56_13950 [Microbacterium sp. Root166]